MVGKRAGEILNARTNDYIVKDSSMPKFKNTRSYSLARNKDATLKIGVVRDIVNIENKDIHYIVEVWVGGKYTPIQCGRTCRFGGIYNYEEFTHRGFEPTDSISSDGLFDFKKGDCVLVAYLLGGSLDGVIVNRINHPGRPKLFKPADGVVYESEFNGVNKSITKDGEYTVTFKGLQTNISELESPSDGQPIPAPEYDTEVGSSYYKFDNTGGFIVSDNATSDPQSIHINKPGGQIVITSGKTTLTIDKDAETYEIVNKSTTIASEDDFLLETKKTKIDSTDEIDMETKLFKTKGDWEEEGNKIIEGAVTVKGPTGNVFIDGNLTTLGITSLSGGQFALVYDVILSIGSGNLGLPVVSQLTLLKTTLTRAT